MIGEILDGKYEIVRLLGEGGMGAVYEAKHAGTGERVAVKMISLHLLLKKDTESVRRFRREAKAAGAIDSPHIARVLDAGTEPETGAPYLVMEYLHGEDFEQLLKRVGALKPKTALEVIAQACIGLHKAHEARVVHRDIKPANLFLAHGDGHEIVVKIVDFGIAKIKVNDGETAQASGVTRTGAMLGSPLYMSPEQARGAKELDHRTDIWSLGVALYRALSGRAPHEDISGFGELIMALCAKPPQPIQEIAPWVSPDIAAILHRSLQIDPDDRFQSALAMLDAIKPLLPGGFGLREEHLVELTAQERSVVAPKLDLTLPAAIVQSAPRHVVLVDRMSDEIDATVPASLRHKPRKRRWTPIVPWVAATTAIGAAVVYTAMRAPWQASSPSIAASATPSALAEEPSAPVPAAPEQASSAAPSLSVKLAIVPSDASVEIDGDSAPFKDGVVELAGALGSVHQVRVFKGHNELVKQVVITADGALPARLELQTNAKPARAVPATTAAVSPPNATPTPKPSGTAARPKPTADPLIPDSFQ